MTSTQVDRLVLFGIGGILLYSLGLLVHAHFNGEHLGEWVWERHQHQFSWYSRPLFIVPACYYAYRRRVWHVLGFMLLIVASLFWFESPEHVPANVRGYLEWENQLFFANKSRMPLIILVVTVVAFLFALFYAFWKRSLWYGLLIINFGTLMKIVVSIWLGEAAGMAAIAPSLSSLAVINCIAFVVWKMS